ncbi:MAG: hypothetical protein E7360_01055 [Clostridiales bacterium]|nr:hypothetical protein [Clostridiales bacterium]
MKRKYLSLITAVLSLLAIAVYAVLGVLFIMRVANGNEFIPKVEKSFWLYEVIQRVGKAGFNVFFSIIGIILSVILMTYRGTLAYFYFKVFKGDGAFYKERKGEIVFFSVLAGIVCVLAGWFFVNANIIPPEFKFVTLPLFITYILLCVLPIAEMILNKVIKIASSPKATAKEVPTKENIVKELDKLADETAKNALKEKEENKDRQKAESQETAQKEENKEAGAVTEEKTEEQINGQQEESKPEEDKDKATEEKTEEKGEDNHKTAEEDKNESVLENKPEEKTEKSE